MLPRWHGLNIWPAPRPCLVLRTRLALQRRIDATLTARRGGGGHLRPRILVAAALKQVKAKKIVSHRLERLVLLHGLERLVLFHRLERLILFLQSQHQIKLRPGGV